MIFRRASAERGWADHGWLQTRHSFSFADYVDPRYMGWGNLRVINEDVIAPGTGFGMHGHRDMEIVTYVLDGELWHRDSLGHVAAIHAGEVQRMSAGSGVRHSEFSGTQGPTHLLQIWVHPTAPGGAPSYEQTAFDPAAKRARLLPIAVPVDQVAAVAAHGPRPVGWRADAVLYAGCFDGSGEAATHTLAPGRLAYVHVVRGSVAINGARFDAGDAALVQEESALHLTDGHEAEVLLFDLAPAAPLAERL
ncbi:pirin family protein [Tepidimonas charontis]|uniref:Quercetin 2,3-dioxygenase n=1 Tax=Tepidimonas charontis TaxID=2267262 RepID=A0A554XDG1_9BURK|nr:pirin family protein [Tepidimonas charontis]TSE33881.1 Quercetin 2,3-dioxygenase [Tepidimonas charontis]